MVTRKMMGFGLSAAPTEQGDLLTYSPRACVKKGNSTDHFTKCPEVPPRCMRMVLRSVALGNGRK